MSHPPDIHALLKDPPNDLALVAEALALDMRHHHTERYRQDLAKHIAHLYGLENLRWIQYHAQLRHDAYLRHNLKTNTRNSP
jgi:hypothetical protein